MVRRRPNQELDKWLVYESTKVGLALFRQKFDLNWGRAPTLSYVCLWLHWLMKR